MKRETAIHMGRRALIALGFVVIFGVHLAMSLYYLDHNQMNADEGFYAIAARKVLSGELPYRDFAYTQMPLLPYWNGLAMELVGYGITEQRALNIVWSCLGLLGMILALRQRLGRWEPSFVAAFAVAASPHWATLQAVGTSHGAAGMFLTLAAAAVLTSYPLRWRATAFGFFGALTSGVRLSCGPVLLFLEVILIIEARGWRQRLFAIAVPAVFVAVGLLPFYAAAPEAFVFDVWYYHLATVFDRRCLAQAVEWWQNSPTAILLLVTGLFGLPNLIRKRQWTAIILLAAAIVGVTLPMIPKSAYGLYIAPVILVAAAAGIISIWSSKHTPGNPFRHAIWLCPLIVLYHPLPPTVTSTSNEVEQIGRYLREHVSQGPILTPTPIVAIEADREVIPGTEMGMFAVMHPDDRELAARLKWTTLLELEKILQRKVPAAVVKMKGASRWNFKWTIPSLRRQPPHTYSRFERALRANYKLAKKFKQMEVLIPK